MSDRSEPRGNPSEEPKPGVPSDRSEADPAADSGVFGKLPRSRPGTRSPRRAGAAEASGRRAASTPMPQPRPRSRASRPSRKRVEPLPDAAPAAQERTAPDPEEQGAGLEELAWAGIAVTAEAATLGVRLVSRAIDAARRAAERG